MTPIQLFLKRQGLYKIFVKNVYQYNKIWNKNFTYKDAIKKTNNLSSLVTAFSWSETKQGYEFWKYQEAMFAKFIVKYKIYTQYG